MGPLLSELVGNHADLPHFVPHNFFKTWKGRGDSISSIFFSAAKFAKVCGGEGSGSGFSSLTFSFSCFF